MSKQEDLLSLLELLSKSTEINAKTSNLALRLTVRAFRAKTTEGACYSEKTFPAAKKALLKCGPWLKAAYRQYLGSMCLDLRQNAQMSLSGMQFMLDEMREKIDNNLEAKELEELESDISSERDNICVYIKCTVGEEPENVMPEEISLEGIPPSHFWWFYPEEDEASEEEESESDEDDNQTSSNLLALLSPSVTNQASCGLSRSSSTNNYLMASF